MSTVRRRCELPSIYELKAEAEAKANEKPGCPQAERMAIHVLDATPTPMTEHTAELRVIALYSTFHEKMALFNPSWTAEQKPKVAGYSYMLLDMRRGAHNRALALNELAAERVLEGDFPLELPEPEDKGDPFEGFDDLSPLPRARR